MKLYLEQFNIPCCVLNSELPVATRLHTVNIYQVCRNLTATYLLRWSSSTKVSTM